MTFPGGLQVGGGVNADNATDYLNAGASHVIVTSYVFREGRLEEERLRGLVRMPTLVRAPKSAGGSVPCRCFPLSPGHISSSRAWMVHCLVAQAYRSGCRLHSCWWCSQHAERVDCFLQAGYFLLQPVPSHPCQAACCGLCLAGGPGGQGAAGAGPELPQARGALLGGHRPLAALQRAGGLRAHAGRPGCALGFYMHPR